MTTEKPNFWKISDRPGQWIGIEEVDTIPSVLVLGLHDVGMNDVYQHIVELHNASEVQRVTGWMAGFDSDDGWIVCLSMRPEIGQRGWIKKIKHETPAKAILAAWEFMQNQQPKGSVPSRT